MNNQPISGDDAVRRLIEVFPFPNYVEQNLAPYATVAQVVGKHLSPGDKLFDLGCGPCDKTAIAQLMGVDCTAVDDLQDEWHLRGNNVETIECFAKSVRIDFSREFTPPTAGTFDMVMLNDVLEHIHDSPRELMNSLVDGLKVGGLVFVTVPNLANIRKRIDLLRGRTNLPRFDLYYWYRGPWRGPQREYTRGDLRSMCKYLGLEIVQLTTVHHMLVNLPHRLHRPYKMATSVFPDWRDTWLLLARKPEGWCPQLDLSDQDFAKIYGQANRADLYADR